MAEESGAEFTRSWAANAALLRDAGGIDLTEHDACGVGLVAALDGKARREVVQAGIDALKAVWHRGAVDADGKTGDGAGIHVEIPQDFFAEAVERGGDRRRPGRIAVGMVFLPKTDLGAQERCRQIVETEILSAGYAIHSWRQVPIDVGCIGEKANATRPEIEQILVWNPRGKDDADYERDLYVIRRRIERQAIAAQIPELYLCSLSCRSVIYKGMFLAEHLTEFYPDLRDPRFVSRFAIYHQRYSTNTFPTWKLAQPFRMLAHNGEINTVSGNANWMRSHETRLSHPLLDPFLDDIKPVVQAGGSDTATLDNVFELLVRGGRDAPMAKAMLIPELLGNNATMPEAHRDLFLYCNAVMEPWDGPAAIAATDGRWAIAGLDRNGLRPMRYTVTHDGLLVTGSETGMVKLAEERIAAKGRVGPGQCIGVDLDSGRFFTDAELKDELAARKPFGQWTARTTRIDDIVRADAVEKPVFGSEELRRRQLAVGYTLEELESILHPMVEEANEAVGSMGDDTPVAVLSRQYRGLHHYFRQTFSQVTNPPIDSLRETRVMTLEDPPRQPGQHPRRGPDPVRHADAGQPGAVQRRIRRHARLHGRHELRGGLHLRRRRGRGGAARGVRPHPARGGGGGAQRLRPCGALRPEAGAGARADPDDPGGGRGAHAPGAPLAPHLHQPERPRRRVPGRALRRRADRRRRDHGERLPRAGEHRRPPAPRPVRRREAARVRGPLQEGGGQGPAQGDVQDGHLRPLLLPRRHELRGHRPVARPGQRVLPRRAEPHLRHRPLRHRAARAGAAQQGLGRGRGAPAGGRPLQAPPARREPRLRRRADPHPPARGGHRQLHHLQALRGGGAPPAAGGAARPAGLPLRGADAGADRGGGEHHRDPEAPSRARHLARRAFPGGARDALHRHEPHRGTLGQRRGRRGPGARPAAPERRQRQQRHQADRLRPLRRHRRVPEQLPRDRDQDRPGREARRGRPAPRLQGFGADRQAAPLDPRRDPDLAAAAPRHLLDRGPGAAHLRPEADQPGRHASA